MRKVSNPNIAARIVYVLYKQGPQEPSALLRTLEGEFSPIEATPSQLEYILAELRRRRLIVGGRNGTPSMYALSAESRHLVQRAESIAGRTADVIRRTEMALSTP